MVERNEKKTSAVKGARSLNR